MTATDAAPSKNGTTKKNGKPKLSKEDKELVRQAAEEKIERDGVIEQMNKRHAVVNTGSDVAIVSEQPGQPPQFMKAEAFHRWYANQFVFNGFAAVPVSGVWLKSKQRRQYERLVFDPRDRDPDHYNLWRGFAVKPNGTKSCELFLEHIRHNICSGNEEHYQWVLGFLAHMVQKPHEKPGVALALRGIEGVGKGFFANWVGRLLAPEHYLVISQSAHLTGRFNKHQQQAILIFVDEGFWAGDRQGEGTLKHLITDHELLIEPKFFDAFMVRNMTRLIIASNENWMVPAGMQARRWCVLDVDPACANDRAYFRAINDEMENGGLEALMHVLSTFDLSAVDVYTTPKTQALLEQKEESAPLHVRWWLQCLKEGEIRYNEYGSETTYRWTDIEIPKRAFWRSYQHFALAHNIRARLWPDKQLHKWLKKERLLPGAKIVRRRDAEETERPRYVSMPLLDKCRDAFADLVGQSVDWDGVNDYGGDDEDQDKAGQEDQEVRS